MKQAKKIVACTMAATMIVSSAMASGCSKKPKGSNEKVPDDAPWYTVDTIKVGEQYKEDDSVEYSYMQFVAQVGNNLAYYTSGSYYMPEDVNPWEVNSNDYSFDNIDIYSLDGNLVKSIDIREAVVASGYYDYQAESIDGDAEDPNADAEDIEDADAEAADAQAEDADAEDADAEAEDAEDVASDEELIGEGGIAEEGVIIDSWDSDYEYEPTAWWYITGCTVKNGNVVASVTGGIPTDGFEEESVSAEFEFDMETGDLVSSNLVEMDEDDDVSGNSEGTQVFEGYSVNKVWLWSENGDYSYILNVETPDGTSTSYDLRQLLPGVVIYDISQMVYLGDGEVLFKANDADYEETYYTFDLNTGAIDEYSGDTTWFGNDIYNASYVDGVGNVTIDQKGIKKLDFDSQSKEQIFSFDNCNINRYDVMNGLSIVSMTDDQVVLTGTLYRGNGYYVSGNELDTEIFILRKADSNPNAGKTILVAATLGYFDYTLCEAVCTYNDTNPDYFIRLDTKYSVTDKYLSGEVEYDEDNQDDAELELTSELSNQLMIDLLAGDGPDIILDGSSFYQLNNEDYLLNLSDEISTDGLFSNVIDAAKVDEKLYQVPLTIGITGIVANAADVGSDQHGFTFDEYSDFVSGPCNGTDPFQAETGRTQLDIFTECLAMINADCMSGDKVSFDNDSFRALAEYVNDNITDPVDTGNDTGVVYSGMGMGEEQAVATYQQSLAFTSLLYWYSSKVEDTCVLGAPTVDGRGPIIGVSCSVAVSAQTQEKEACVAFVETLLSEDIQTDYGRYDYCNPVRISAYETTAQEAIDAYNKNVEDYSRYMTDAELVEMGMAPVDSSAIDRFESMIETCSQVASIDPAVMSIIREEMPAYFSGQKTLDDVIVIMEDRVQTFINERG